MPRFTINKNASKAPSDGGQSEPETAIIDLTQRKARCIPVTRPHCNSATAVGACESPILLEARDISDIPETRPGSDRLPVALNSNQEGNDPSANSKEIDSIAAMKAPIAGPKAALEARIASFRVIANALTKLKDQKIEGETATKGPDPADLHQALFVKHLKARKEPDEAKGGIVASQARTREDLVAHAKEKLASLFYATAGQSRTEEIKIGCMVATQTTECGQAVSAANADSNSSQWDKTLPLR